ncbi:MAG: hypothetical protein Q9221_008762 [Calogaya cf. arnoldii]
MGVSNFTLSHEQARAIAWLMDLNVQLASKLAESQRQGGYNAPPPQQQQAGYPPPLQAGQKPGTYAPSGQYQQGSQYPPTQHGSQYPPQHQQQYQQGPGQYGQQQGYPSVQVNPQQVEVYKQLLQTTIQQKSLQNMIPLNHPILDRYTQRASSQVDQLCATREIPPEIGRDLVKLALFDIIIYIGKSGCVIVLHKLTGTDNSASMEFHKDDGRINDLKLIMNRAVTTSILFDEDGISIRFMNDWDSNPASDGVDMRRLDNVKDERMVDHITGKIKYTGLTPLGTQLRNKIVEPMVLGPARNRQLQKPVLILTITDGQPQGDGPSHPNTVLFQFAQVGNDQQATAYLAKLDSDPQVGRFVDCTSNYENEEAEIKRTSPGVDFSVELWLLKMLLGSIDSSYDSKDEFRSQPQGYGASVPGIHGAPGSYAQQQYPPQQGSYGQFSQGGHGQPAPAGPYGQQGNAQTQPGYPQPFSQTHEHTPQPGFGRPPPHHYGQQPPPQGYPHPQQSNYNPPPPPPRY